MRLFPGTDDGQFIVVDGEHGNIADADMYTSVGAIAAEGVSPIARIPGLENWMVKRALDSGGLHAVCLIHRAQHLITE